MVPPPAAAPVPFLLIITKENGVFISTKDSDKYSTPQASCFLFDGAAPEVTHHPHWFRIKKEPVKIQRLVPATRRVVGYTLREGFTASVRMPANINMIDLGDSEWEGVAECYEPRFETTPETYADIPFQLYVVAERDNWQPIKTEFPLEYSLLDKILIHPVLLPERPCSLTIDQTYSIIYKHVKENINPKVASIQAYESLKHFNVNKLIETEPVPYTVTEGTKRRPRKVTYYRKSRSVEVYRCAGEYRGHGQAYDGYTCVTPFRGKDYEDLQANIKTFLEELMAMINEPIKDCPHCKGRGVVVQSPV